MANVSIGIIINPNSRLNKKTNCASVREFSKVAGSHADIRATQSMEELKNAIADFKKKKYPYIGISGGDGTIHHVVTAIINEYKKNVPPILLLRDGTMNNIASSVGLKESSKIALRKFIETIDKKASVRLIHRDTIRIEDRYCFLFGFGLTSNILNEVYIFEKKGLRQNIRAIGKTIAEAFLTLTNINEDDLSMLKPMEVEIVVDGEKVPFPKLISVIAGTVENIGMGFSTLYRANDIPGNFHILINGMKPIFLVRELQKIMLGQKIHHPLNFDETCSEVKIKAKEKFSYTMDGDMYTCNGRMTVRSGIPLKFVLPE